MTQCFHRLALVLEAKREKEIESNKKRAGISHVSVTVERKDKTLSLQPAQNFDSNEIQNRKRLLSQNA